ncbi:MAG: hypothetical protein AAF483_00835 [Planctomycetota bacterium]
MMKWICCGLLMVAACLPAVSDFIPQGVGNLTAYEMESKFGKQIKEVPPIGVPQVVCGRCLGQEETFPCNGPFAEDNIDNTCDVLACVVPNVQEIDEDIEVDIADCEFGTKWSGVGVLKASVDPEEAPDHYVALTATSRLCSYKIVCTRGGFDPDLTCYAGSWDEDGYDIGGCAEPEPLTDPTGCWTCSAGPMDIYNPQQTNEQETDCEFCFAFGL